MELFISAARGNGKSELLVYDTFVDILTRGKKKKAFLKWLRGFGIHNEIVDSFEHWIKENKGKYSYSWLNFKWYVLTEYFPINGRN